MYEVGFDRLGAFTGVKMAMSLKGHKSKVRRVPVRGRRLGMQAQERGGRTLSRPGHAALASCGCRCQEPLLQLPVSCSAS